MRLLLIGCVVARICAAETLADTIMARVAENQNRAERARSAFVYEQKVLVRLRDGRGKLVHEESNEYLVTPTPDGTKKELTASRKYERKGKLAEMEADIAATCAKS